MSELRDELEKNFASAYEQSEVQSDLTQEENNFSEPRETEEIIDAPLSYKQEFKENFNSLPLDWQKYLSQREKEVEQGISKANSKYNWLEKIYNDRKENLSAYGYNSLQEYTSALVQLGDELNNNPAAAISHLQEMFGVGKQKDNYAMQKQIDDLAQTVRRQQKFLAQKETSRIQSEVNAFINEKDADGNSAHPYFEELKDEIISILRSGLSDNLADAYLKASWSNPDIRNKQIKSLAKLELDKKVKQADHIKAAIFEPMSKQSMPNKILSLREELERNYDMLGE